MRSKLKFLLTTLLISCSAGAAVFPGGPSLSTGGQVVAGITNGPTASTTEFVLYAYMYPNRYATARKAAATSGYQVTAGKTMYVDSFTCWATGASAGSSVVFWQTTTDIGANSASNGTTPLSISNGGTTTNNENFYIGANAGVPVSFAGLSMPVAAADYLTLDWPNFAANNGGCILWVHEQ